MSRILLLLENKENRRLLGEWLGRSYEVAEGEEVLDSPFDLCILDGISLDRMSEKIWMRRQAEGHVFLPFLLLTPRQDVGLITRHLWRTIDDLIMMPTERIELLARVEILLRARRLSLEAEERYYALAEESPVGVLILQDWCIAYANPSFAVVSRKSPQELSGMSFLEFVHPEDREKTAEYCDGEGQGKRASPCVEVRIMAAEGVLWVELHANKIRYRSGEALLVIVQNISERRRVEELAEELSRTNEQLRTHRDELQVQKEAICKAHDELDLRVKERTAELNRSNQALQEFAAVASHDLQEPLRKISAFGDQLRSRFADCLGDVGRDYLDRMQGATKRMQSMLQALLNYARVTTKAEPFREVNLEDLVREVLEDLEVRIEQTQGTVHFENLPIVEADSSQMRQLFQNLIGNAMKFHGENPPFVKITGQMIEDSCRVRILVADNGIGFDEKYADRIFSPFERLHGRSAYEGTGMGLAICKRIVERHNGVITVKSAPGKGSTFIITLPVKQQHSIGDIEERMD